MRALRATSWVHSPAWFNCTLCWDGKPYRPSREDILPITYTNLWAYVDPKRQRKEGIPQNIAAAWRTIEHVNYKPLTTIAAEMMENTILSGKLGETVGMLLVAVERYLAEGIGFTTNVAADIWQSMIPDRDERAAYYTKPAVAEFLANMTARRLGQDPGKARYAEVCTGTGTLARATEENIRFRHYALHPTKHAKKSIHQERVSGRIQVTDINPQSIAVATVNLASLEPSVPFKESTAFAITEDGGALNYLRQEGVSNMIDSLQGSFDADKKVGLQLEPRSFHICNNNDPYFRTRGGVSNPIATPMNKYKQLADKRVGGVANAQAGLATYMHVIEHDLLSDGGVHGKVLPLTAAHVNSYTGFRKNIETQYRDVIAVCNSAGDGSSFSADTNINEMLLIGTKAVRVTSAGRGKAPRVEGKGDCAITCVNLTRTFTEKVEAKMFADAVRRQVAQGDDYGTIRVGEVVGTYLRMTGLGDGKPWTALGTGGTYGRLADHIINGAAWNPETGSIQPFALPMTTLGDLFTEDGKGPTHHLIGCPPNSRFPCGAFTIYPADEAPERYNPSLWELDAASQLFITCTPTHYGMPRKPAKEVERIRKKMGQFHISRNLRMSSQSIAMAYTEVKCLGGRAWTTLHAKDDADKAVALFLNSTYGIIIRVGYGQSTVAGRAPIQVKAIDGHPIPDFAHPGEAGKRARAIAEANFDDLQERQLDRIALSAIDPNRAELDRVVTLMLGLPWNMETESMLYEWRRLMCTQPTVNGNNKGVLATLAQNGITA